MKQFNAYLEQQLRILKIRVNNIQRGGWLYEFKDKDLKDVRVKDIKEAVIDGDLRILYHNTK